MQSVNHNTGTILILVGGESRNLGKTEFVCRLISCVNKYKFSEVSPGCSGIPSGPAEKFTALSGITPDSVRSVIGVKIKTLRPEESGFHGSPMKNRITYESPDDSSGPGFTITEDTSEKDEAISGKDTLRMRRHGADRVFRVRCRPESLPDMWQEFLRRPAADGDGHDNKKTVIICESNSLREFIKPDVFIMIQRMPLSCGAGSSVKESARRVSELADLTVYSDGENFY